MKLIQTAIPDVVIIEPAVFHDDRGWFMESFNEETFHRELQQLGLPIPPRFVQDNHSYSKKGVLRGLHYQLPPYAQGKLVRVTKGSAYDVAVDIREGSPTFGRSVGVTLSAENQRMLWIPEGFAHGFLALEEVDFLYKTTNFYHKASEASLYWNDADLNIDWPLNGEPLLNEKDNEAPFLSAVKKMPAAKQQVQGLFDLRVIGDERGSLIALENGSNLPFDLKRAYYIFDTKPEVSRGYHAHKNLQQVAVCVAGQCRILLDDGKTRENFVLNSPTKGLLINNLTWREMHDFSEDCILVVFASEHYNESDYIRDYDQFIKEVTNGEK